MTPLAIELAAAQLKQISLDSLERQHINDLYPWMKRKAGMNVIQPSGLHRMVLESDRT